MPAPYRKRPTPPHHETYVPDTSCATTANRRGTLKIRLQPIERQRRPGANHKRAIAGRLRGARNRHYP